MAGHHRARLLDDAGHLRPTALHQRADAVRGHAASGPAGEPHGVYEREFTLAAGAPGARTVLHVGAAESVLLVEVNGVDVGVSKDSHLAAEFDLSDTVQLGRNRIRLRVVKWSDASYIEDQDQWWHGGITRSVYLYQTGPTYLADVSVVAALRDDGSSGTLDVCARMGWKGQDIPAGWQIEAAIDALGGPWSSEVATGALPMWPTAGSDRRLLRQRILGAPDIDGADQESWERLDPLLQPPAPGSAVINATLPGVMPWSAELPQLYRLHVSLVSPAGETVDSTDIPIGFRRVEVRGTDLLVNGRRIYIRGVNRHDFDPATGRVVSRQAMRDDIVAMKRAGFNAVRTSHFRAQDLAAATHQEELVRAPETIIHLDAAHRGVGTASCGPDTLPAYMVGPGTYHWTWTLQRGATSDP